MFSNKLAVKKTDKFRVPFGIEMTWDEIIEQYPHMTNPEYEMNGNSPEDCLSFYYSKNILTGIYEFRDEDAEYDMINRFQIDLNIVTEGETDEDQMLRKQMTYLCEYLENTDNECNNEYNEYNELNNVEYEKGILSKLEIKKMKKERRIQRLTER
jgi:hypothetical protein